MSGGSECFCSHPCGSGQGRSVLCFLGTAWGFRMQNVLWWQLSLGLGSLSSGGLLWVAGLAFMFVCFSQLYTVVILWICLCVLSTGALCTLPMVPPWAPVTPAQLWRWWVGCCLWAFPCFPMLLEFPIACLRLVVSHRQALGTERLSKAFLIWTVCLLGDNEWVMVHGLLLVERCRIKESLKLEMTFKIIQLSMQRQHCVHH